MIGDDIMITIVEVRGDRVRLGITAPRHVAVDRTEVRGQYSRAKPGRRDHPQPETGNA